MRLCQVNPYFHTLLHWNICFYFIRSDRSACTICYVTMDGAGAANVNNLGLGGAATGKVDYVGNYQAHVFDNPVVPPSLWSIKCICHE